MKNLIIFNFIVNVIIVSKFIYKKNPFYFEIQRTFWCKKPYAITLWMYTSRTGFSSNSKRLYTLYLINPNKADEWDTKMFRSGKYKNYNK